MVTFNLLNGNTILFLLFTTCEKLTIAGRTLHDVFYLQLSNTYPIIFNISLLQENVKLVRMCFLPELERFHCMCYFFLQK